MSLVKMWPLSILLVLFISSQATSSVELVDCDSPSLSIKSRSLCKKQQEEGGAKVTTDPTQGWWNEDARDRHFEDSRNDNEDSFESTTPRIITTTEKFNETPEPFYVTTTPDPFADEPEIDNLDIFGNETMPCGFEQPGDSCKNISEPIIRWRDPVFEKLINQVWNDHEAKITEDKAIKGIGLDPLIIDSSLIPGGKVSVNQTSTFYAAKLAIWDIQIFGLSTVQLTQVLVTRASDLSDLEMSVSLGFPTMAVNGTYDLDGWMGWAAVHSGGPQPFDVEIMNATITARITLDTTVGDGTGCGADGGVLITDLGIPLNYDDISIHFNNIGSFYNTMVNGVGIYLIKMQETNLVGALKKKIREDVNSLLC